MATSARRDPISLTILTIIASITALYFAQGILIPLALAILFTFIATPVVILLGRAGVPRALSVILVCSFSIATVVGIGVVVGSQFTDLVRMLPQYQTNVTRRIESIRGPIGSGLAKMTMAVRDLSTELEKRKERSAGRPAREERDPVPVQLVPDPGQSLHYVSVILSPVISFLATAFIVTILSVFMLLNREDLRDRIIRLAGKGRLRTTTSVLADAAARVSRYLLMQLVIFTGYGLVIGIGLSILGLPNAALFGFLAGILKFVPYLGTWVGAALPLLVSLAVFDGWIPTLQMAALFLIVEFVTSNFIEPKFFGATTGLAPIAVLTSTFFWTWLWGGVGLILATPLTVCLAVIGRNVPRFEFLSILLSDQPVLSPDVNFYQRLLAGDRDESIEIVDRYSKQFGISKAYEEVIIPALSMMKQEAVREEFDEVKRTFAEETVARIVEESAPELPQMKEGPKVLVGAVASLFDPLVASMVVQDLRAEGMIVDELPEGNFLDGWTDVKTSSYDAVILAALPPTSRADLRYALRRCKLQFSGSLSICFLPEAKHGEGAERPSTLMADGLAVSMDELATLIDELRSKRTRSDNDTPKVMLAAGGSITPKSAAT